MLAQFKPGFKITCPMSLCTLIAIYTLLIEFYDKYHLYEDIHFIRIIKCVYQVFHTQTRGKTKK